MGELLDRIYQKEILEILASSYPASPSPMIKAFGELDSRFSVNIFYLMEHGLVKVGYTEPSPGRFHFISAKITAKGLDFLQDDGGLGAVLGIVTIQLHDETLKQLLIRKIEDSADRDEVKSQFIAKVKSLPAEALQKITLDLVDKGLANLPSLSTLLGGLSS